MARKSERRKSADRRADRGSRKGVTKKVAAPAPTPPPAKIKFRGKLLENEPLASYNTWRIGGPALLLALRAVSKNLVFPLKIRLPSLLAGLVLGLGRLVSLKVVGLSRT